MPAALRSRKCPSLDDKLGGYIPYKLTSDSVVVIQLTFLERRKILGDRGMFPQRSQVS